ncbi:hypothetical protein CVIRNUC_005081 [Coccomyxa viridis]|uniref:Uncharacterized protein n=1 Tax=Coccomyxa viridis TaxID=1274662 RepID=A0AAV1I7U5_9CHLO|nr:hypothetical protein CVIRNUC_005081 [Coccomyxa viridis]
MEASAALESKNELKKVLGLPLLVFICLGQIIGSGIFVLTGVAAHDNAGPAVVVSYAISAVMAFLSAVTFVEMAVDYPLAGSSFNYCLAVLGEYPAFITVWAFVVDAILAGGAVARSWSSYLAQLCGKNSNFFKIQHGGYDLDVVAMGITLVVTALVAYGTKESASFNLVFKGTTIILIIVVLCLSYPHAHRSNLEDFFPKHDSGVFAGAAVVFFAYNGMGLKAPPESGKVKSLVLAFSCTYMLVCTTFCTAALTA